MAATGVTNRSASHSTPSACGRGRSSADSAEGLIDYTGSGVYVVTGGGPCWCCQPPTGVLPERVEATMPEHGALEFSPAPSLAGRAEWTIAFATSIPSTTGAVAVAVGATGAVPPSLSIDRDRLTGAGFDGSVGSAMVVTTPTGPTIVAVGIGDSGGLDPGALRDAAAAFARATASKAQVAFSLEGLGGVPP